MADVDITTKQRARAALALFLHTVQPEAPGRTISAVSMTSELILSGILTMDREGSLAAFARLSPTEMRNKLTEQVEKICNPETLAPVASAQMLETIALLVAWQSGICDAYVRQDVGTNPVSILGS